MERPDYLASYNFSWDSFDVIIGGKSSIDAENYLYNLDNKNEVHRFLAGYGFDPNDPIQMAELFGYFQDAVQFIRRYFLKEGSPDGLDMTIPSSILSATDISDLFLAVAGGNKKISFEESLWAGIILKVMHTILHADKDLRHRYFSVIQQQVLDRFYRYLHRDQNNNLYLLDDESETKIPLFDFQTKSKKMRDSIIIKLLHKKENVAEELFDRIGVRIIAQSKIDVLRVVKFLSENYVFSINNVKPSRSHNSLFNMDEFKKTYRSLLKEAIKEKYSEEEFIKRAEVLITQLEEGAPRNASNIHTFKEYKAIHFTCRQLIKYKNPFMKEFSKIRSLAKKAEDSELSKLILNIDTSTIAASVNFFYPFEVQITDYASHLKNTEGEASHQEYKRQQQKSAMLRLFNPLLKYKNITI